MSRIVKNTQIKGKLYFTKDLATVIQTLVSNQSQFLWSWDGEDENNYAKKIFKTSNSESIVSSGRVISAENLDGVLSIYQTYWVNTNVIPNAWRSTGTYRDRYICDGQIYNFNGTEYYRWVKHEWIKEGTYKPYYITTKNKISFYTPVSLNIIGYIKNSVPVQVESAVSNGLGENLVNTYYQLPNSTTITGQKLMNTQVGSVVKWSSITGTPKVYTWECPFEGPTSGTYAGWSAILTFVSPTTVFKKLTQTAQSITLSVPVHVTIYNATKKTVYSDNLNTLAAKRTISGSGLNITVYTTLTSGTSLMRNTGISLTNFKMKSGNEIKYGA